MFKDNDFNVGELVVWGQIVGRLTDYDSEHLMWPWTIDLGHKTYGAAADEIDRKLSTLEQLLYTPGDVYDGPRPR